MHLSSIYPTKIIFLSPSQRKKKFFKLSSLSLKCKNNALLQGDAIYPFQMEIKMQIKGIIQRKITSMRLFPF